MLLSTQAPYIGRQVTHWATLMVLTGCEKPPTTIPNRNTERISKTPEEHSTKSLSTAEPSVFCCIEKDNEKVCSRDKAGAYCEYIHSENYVFNTGDRKREECRKEASYIRFWKTACEHSYYLEKGVGRPASFWSSDASYKKHCTDERRNLHDYASDKVVPCYAKIWCYKSNEYDLEYCYCRSDDCVVHAAREKGVTPACVAVTETARYAPDSEHVALLVKESAGEVRQKIREADVYCEKELRYARWVACRSRATADAYAFLDINCRYSVKKRRWYRCAWDAVDIANRDEQAAKDACDRACPTCQLDE